MVDVTSYLYPLDPTGTAATNKVTYERKTLNPPTEPLDFHFVIPAATPYFADTMKIKHITSGRDLIRGIDWTPGHKFHTASFELQGILGGIYGSILLYDTSLSGELELTEYQTLGAEWTLDQNKILEILSNRAVDPRLVTYEEVSGKPDVYPPIEHNHAAEDLTGFTELIAAAYDIAAAIRERTQDWLANPPILMGDYYSKDEVDALIQGLGFDAQDLMAQIDTKLDKTATAVNSSKLEGKSLNEVLQLAYQNTGSMGQRALFVSTSDPDNSLGANGDVWFKY